MRVLCNAAHKSLLLVRAAVSPPASPWVWWTWWSSPSFLRFKGEPELLESWEQETSRESASPARFLALPASRLTRATFKNSFWNVCLQLKNGPTREGWSCQGRKSRSLWFPTNLIPPPLLPPLSGLLPRTLALVMVSVWKPWSHLEIFSFPPSSSLHAYSCRDSPLLWYFLKASLHFSPLVYFSLQTLCKC